MESRAAGGVALLAAAFGLSYAAAQNPPLVIVNDGFPNGMVGQDYLEELRYSGGCASDLTPKPLFSVEAGTLPAGLNIETLSNAGSVLAGTPAAAGTYSFTLQVVDSCGASASKAFSITIEKNRRRNGAGPKGGPPGRGRASWNGPPGAARRAPTPSDSSYRL